MQNRIDHIVIGCDTLEAGQAALEPTLGFAVPSGSKHTAMSTHNCVCQSGNESFLELIAIDPGAPSPGRTRWFTLDDPATQARLAIGPQALTWVVGTDDLDATVANSPVDLGEIVHFERAGRTWRLTVREDGSLPEGGLVPGFIEWSPGPHPSTGQQDLGLTLKNVVLSHPEPGHLEETLRALKIDHLAAVSEGARALAFDLDTPQGPVQLA